MVKFIVFWSIYRLFVIPYALYLSHSHFFRLPLNELLFDALFISSSLRFCVSQNERRKKKRESKNWSVMAVSPISNEITSM